MAFFFRNSIILRLVKMSTIKDKQFRFINDIFDTQKVLIIFNIVYYVQVPVFFIINPSIVLII